MASGQTTAVASGKKIRTGKRVLPNSPPSRKLKMKYIELDPDNQFHNLSETNDDYSLGELYQVTKHNKKEHSFEFTGVKRVVADLELIPAQDRILKDMLKSTNESIEQYLMDAVIGRLQADIDRYYQDSRREPAFKAVQSWKVRRR